MRGYWSSAWPGEDGGPERRQTTAGALGLDGPAMLTATFRAEVACTMVVQRGPGELFLLTHTLGGDTTARVERIDPVTLTPLARSPELPGGPMWPGGIAVGADGHLLCVYGRWCHRLEPDDLRPVAARELPRPRPYNSFVLLDDGTLVTKDFAKDGEAPSRLCALDPVTLELRVDEYALPERSIARLSAAGDTVYVVGEAHLWRLRWTGSGFERDSSFSPPYLQMAGQGYGWDAVLAAGAAWFLDNGEGTEAFAGTFRGHGIASAPLHLVRADLTTGAVALTEVCGLPGGLIANPPVVDERRGIVVGYDSGNGVLAAFDTGDRSVRWRREQDHASHLLLYEESGELVTHDHDGERMADQVVVLDIETGTEVGRVDTGSPIQSVLFPAPGFGRDLYSCSFAGVSRVAVV